MTTKFGAGITLGIVGTVLVAIIIWVTVVYTGAYNVAATDQHADAVRWTLDTTMRRSVARRAGRAELPEGPSQTLLAEGAGHYAKSCAYCHGAPGQQASEWSRGMRPQPPHLVEAAKEWSADEIHWIVTNGIKMTGMPAFGPHHTPEEILALTAFVSAPRDCRPMTTQKWRVLLEETPASRNLPPQAARTESRRTKPW
jgi:mono/diheme cytochrome c family protein